MDITITINTDNAAFEHGPKAEVLRILADALKPGSGPLRQMDRKPLRDINGNTVGQIRIADNDSE